MKKKIVSVIILSFLLGGAVFAQDTEPPAVSQAEPPSAGLPAVALAKAGLTPNSPFYFLERIAEGIGTFFTLGDLKKAKRHTTLAAERLAETKAMIEKGKLKKVEKTLKRYENQLVKALSRAEKAKAKGKDTKETAKTMAESARKNFTVLEKVLEKVPEEAKPAIKHAMIASTKEGLEIIAEASKGKDALSGSLRALCTEKGGPPEMCEKIPLEGFESFKSFESFCLEGGGPPETCAALETQCREIGITTAGECFRALSSTRIESRTAPVREESRSREEAGQTYEELEAQCLEMGGSAEVCAMDAGQTYADLEAQCLESGGPPEQCALGETRCKALGAKTADECKRINFEMFMGAELKAVKQEAESQSIGEAEEPAPPAPSRAEGSEAEGSPAPSISKVIIYSTPTCPYCIRAKQWLKDNNIEYEDFDVSQNEENRNKLIEITGRTAVPVIIAGNEMVIGFNKDRLAELLGVE